MWQKLAKTFGDLVPNAIKKFAVSYTLKALGLAGGFWTWLIEQVFLKIWKAIEPELKAEAKKADQKIIDDKNADQYKKDKKENADTPTLIQDELDILNGKRSH